MNYTNQDFQNDLNLARTGDLDSSALWGLVEKWGPRGGAFYNFIRS